MEQLLQQLLEAEILTEGTMVELREAFDTQLKEAKEEAERQVRAELSEQWVEQRDNLIEALDAKVVDMMTTELTELKDDIEGYRDLKAEYAENLVEAKAEMRQRLEEDLTELVEKIDAFLEMRLTAEVDELREDIADVKKTQYGRKVFEALMDEFRSNFVEEDSAEAELAEVRRELAEARSELESQRKETEKQLREAKMSELLKPLQGRQRDIMETILRKIPTDSLEEGFEVFIGRVISKNINENEESVEKEDKVLAEKDSSQQEEENKVDTQVSEGVVVTGDVEQVITESDDGVPTMTAEQIAHMKRLAGIK